MRPLAILVLVVLAIAGCAGATPSPQLTAHPSESPLAVATPTVAPTASPSPSPTSAPTPTGEARWDRLAAIRLGDEDVRGAVGFEDGYVVIDWTPMIRFSPDGVKWTAVRLPFKGGVGTGAQAVATDGKRVVVVGSYLPCGDPYDGGCRQRPVSWISDDGRTWRSSGPWTGPGGDGSDFEWIWAVPTGGWDASQMFYMGHESESSGAGPTLWHSEDGLKWTLLGALSPPHQTPDCDDPGGVDSFWALADASGRRVGYQPFRCGNGFSLSSSTDGRRYEPVEAFPHRDGQWMGSALAPTRSGPWVFGGGRQVSDSDREAMAWASDDLGRWTVVVMPVPENSTYSFLGALGHGLLGYVATGGAGFVDRHAITWLSDDGMSWRIADARPSADEEIYAIADGPAGTLGFGSEYKALNEYESEITMIVSRLTTVP